MLSAEEEAPHVMINVGRWLVSNLERVQKGERRDVVTVGAVVEGFGDRASCSWPVSGCQTVHGSAA